MYNSSKTFTLPKLAGVHYLLSFIEGKATLDFNKTSDAYVMILARDDFYMDAEVPITAIVHTLYSRKMERNITIN